jgi:signal peptidase
VADYIVHRRAQNLTTKRGRGYGALKANLRGAIFYIFLAVGLVLAAELVIYETAAGSPVYAIVSSSMAPTFDVGDLALVGTVPFSSIQVGDVIVFARPTSGGTCGGEIIIHRVVGIASNGGLITQGDDRQTNPTPDEPTEWPYVTAACVKGEVLMSVPYLGSVTTSFPPPYDYLLMAAILILIFLTGFLGGKEESNESGPAAAAALDFAAVLGPVRAALCGVVRCTDGSGSGGTGVTR